MAEFLEGIEDFDEVEVQEHAEKPAEPVPGGYILKIIGAKLERYSNSNSVAIKIAFDIDEGDYKGYYKKLNDYNKSFDEKAKWKGTFNVWYPNKADEPDLYNKSMQNFKRAITAINDSNPTKIDVTKKFSMDAFKGKKVGAAFGLSDWEYYGKTGTKCECRWFASVDRVKSGEMPIPKHKGLKGAAPITQTAADDTANTDSVFGDFEEILSDGEVPF